LGKFQTRLYCGPSGSIAQRPVQPNPFHQANAVIEQFQERTEAILEHVANSTVDTSTISTLTTQNQTLTEQLANATMGCLSMKEMVQCLYKEVSDLKDTKKGRPNLNKNNKSYCWTHGRTRNNGHTSAKCRNRAEGHKN